jgi:3alpha(or 20beta)-hydroxysteroid dehydrogenase
MFELNGKIAVVTGAASGIGRAVAERFAAAGAVVVLGDIADASDLANDLGGSYVYVDVSDEEAVQSLMSTAASLYGQIDISVNNAGVFITEADIAAAPTADVERAFRINALSVFFGMKHAVGYMQRGAAIVNTASLAGVLGFPTYVGYSAAKAAVIQMTKVAAVEFGPLGIRVNCICPSSVNTPMLAAQADGDVEAAICSTLAPLGTILEPEHVAALVHFLAAEDCPVISGQAINIDAGMTTGVSIAVIDSVVTTAGVRGGADRG